MAITLDPQGLHAELMAVQRPLDAYSPLSVAARYFVDAARPGAQRD